MSLYRAGLDALAGRDVAAQPVAPVVPPTRRLPAHVTHISDEAADVVLDMLGRMSHGLEESEFDNLPTRQVRNFDAEPIEHGDVDPEAFEADHTFFREVDQDVLWGEDVDSENPFAEEDAADQEAAEESSSDDDGGADVEEPPPIDDGGAIDSLPEDDGGGDAGGAGAGGGDGGGAGDAGGGGAALPPLTPTAPAGLPRYSDGVPAPPGTPPGTLDPNNPKNLPVYTDGTRAPVGTPPGTNNPKNPTFNVALAKSDASVASGGTGDGGAAAMQAAQNEAQQMAIDAAQSDADDANQAFISADTQGKFLRARDAAKTQYEKDQITQAYVSDPLTQQLQQANIALKAAQQGPQPTSTDQTQPTDDSSTVEGMLRDALGLSKPTKSKVAAKGAGKIVASKLDPALVKQARDLHQKFVAVHAQTKAVHAKAAGGVVTPAMKSQMADLASKRAAMKVARAQLKSSLVTAAKAAKAGAVKSPDAKKPLVEAKKPTTDAKKPTTLVKAPQVSPQPQRAAASAVAAPRTTPRTSGARMTTRLHGEEMPDVFAPPPPDDHFPRFKKHVERFKSMEPAAKVIRVDSVESYREWCEKKDLDKLATAVAQLREAVTAHAADDDRAHKRIVAAIQAHASDGHGGELPAEILGLVRKVKKLRGRLGARGSHKHPWEIWKNGKLIGYTNARDSVAKWEAIFARYAPYSAHYQLFHNGVMIDELNKGKGASVLGAADKEIDLALPTWAKDKVKCWQDGGRICCSICFPAADGTTKVATATTPGRDHVQEVLGSALAAGADPVALVGVLPDLTRVLGGRKLIRDLAAAAQHAAKRSEVLGAAGPVVLADDRKGNPQLAAVIALHQDADYGDPQAQAEVAKLEKIATTDAGKKKGLPYLLAEGRKRLDKARGVDSTKKFGIVDRVFAFLNRKRG